MVDTKAQTAVHVMAAAADAAHQAADVKITAVLNALAAEALTVSQMVMATAAAAAQVRTEIKSINNMF